MFWSAAISWLADTKLGRWVAGVSAALLAVALLLWRVFAAGKNAEKLEQAKQSAKNLESRSKTDEDIKNTPAADRRKQLGEWVRPD